MSTPDRKEIEASYRQIQSLICEKIEETDGAGKFIKDSWKREGGGGGLTRVMSEGSVLEKAGVNFSAVEGEVTPMMAKNLGMDAKWFFATGVSIVMHPHNPHVPIIHMNIRYFETDKGDYWFGGGIDLTPHYVVEKQAKQFHRSLKEVCDRFDSSWYPRFKKQADDYFYIPHRNETRGIGGIFYDHESEDSNQSKSEILEFSLALGRLFPEVYSSLINENRDKAFSNSQKEWQKLRRGRYVEFNLVYDRGTRFGLLSNGRTESILMSLPKEANWFYDFYPEQGSEEEKTLALLKKEIDWIKA
ncbi:oxygen-dependent coproporphyrinogen oxidase [Cryomorphaceae bacterium 1068]|nr:oxygen-dependent coproporphyrinogen oxidase [Cryomorphaceae bacterium 1068]